MKPLTITLIVLTVVLTAAVIALSVVFVETETSGAAALTASPSVSNVVTSIVQSQTTVKLTLKTQSGACVMFNLGNSPNVLTTGVCQQGADWVYDETAQSLSYAAPSFQFCMLAPFNTGDSVLGGNSNCTSAVTYQNNTIENADQTLCVTLVNGSWEWGSCSDAYVFQS